MTIWSCSRAFVRVQCSTSHFEQKHPPKRLLLTRALFHCMLPVMAIYQPSWVPVPDCSPCMLRVERDQYGPQVNIPAGGRIVVPWVFVSWEPPQDHPTWGRWRCLINNISSSSPERQVQFNWTKTHFGTQEREKNEAKGQEGLEGACTERYPFLSL